MASEIYYVKPTIIDAWLTDDCPPRYRRAVDRAADPHAALGSVPSSYVKKGAASRKSRWRVMWTDASGHRRNRSFADRSAADGYAAALERGEVTGRDYRGAPRTMREVVDAWLDTKVSLRQGTLERYKREARCYVIPQWGDVDPRDITSADIQRWVNALHDGNYPHVAGCAGRPMARKSIRSIVMVVTAGALRYAQRQGWITADPTVGVELPRNDTPPIRPLTAAQLATLAQAVYERGQCYGDLVMVLALTGMRIGEACALKVGDVDTTARTIHVQRTWSDDRTLQPPKNGHSRTIAYPPALDSIMAAATSCGEPDDWLLTGPRPGSHLDPHNFRQRAWRPATRENGLEWATPHTLRHTYATMAIQSGAVVKDVQTQLGHSSATITLDTYAAWWRTDLSSVASAVAARMGAVGSSPAPAVIDGGDAPKELAA